MLSRSVFSDAARHGLLFPEGVWENFTPDRSKTFHSDSVCENLIARLDGFSGNATKKYDWVELLQNGAPLCTFCVGRVEKVHTQHYQFNLIVQLVKALDLVEQELEDNVFWVFDHYLALQNTILELRDTVSITEMVSLHSNDENSSSSFLWQGQHASSSVTDVLQKRTREVFTVLQSFENRETLTGFFGCLDNRFVFMTSDVPVKKLLEEQPLSASTILQSFALEYKEVTPGSARLHTGYLLPVDLAKVVTANSYHTFDMEYVECENREEVALCALKLIQDNPSKFDAAAALEMALSVYVK